MILATITDGKVKNPKFRNFRRINKPFLTNQKAENELKLIFQTSAQMLEFERQSKLSVDTMPGTKILIQNPKFVESYIAINNSVRVLGHGSKFFFE